jgi:5-methylcytosine-specific restriction endonuclease McrA
MGYIHYVTVGLFPRLARKPFTPALYRLSRSNETPYRDESTSRPAPPRSASSRSAPSRDTSSGSARRPHPSRSSRAAHKSHDTASLKPGRRRSSRRGKRGTGSPGPVRLTSQATSRTAYVETRVWLLERHGPVCAYCGQSFSAQVMTLDHVAPRRGQTAYDRRDNLVLACPACNAAKRDLAPMAFLLGSRTRAANLLRYGAHLSPGLVDMARSLVPAESLAPSREADREVRDWPPLDAYDDGDSPYRD